MDWLIGVIVIGIAIAALHWLGEKIFRRNSRGGKRTVLFIAGALSEVCGICLIYALYDADEWDATMTFLLFFMVPTLTIMGIAMIAVSIFAKPKTIDDWFDKLLGGIG